MYNTSLTPPAIDQATIDHYVAKARRERSRAFVGTLRSLFATRTTAAARMTAQTA